MKYTQALCAAFLFFSSYAQPSCNDKGYRKTQQLFTQASKHTLSPHDRKKALTNIVALLQSRKIFSPADFLQQCLALPDVDDPGCVSLICDIQKLITKNFSYQNTPSSQDLAELTYEQEDT